MTESSSYFSSYSFLGYFFIFCLDYFLFTLGTYSLGYFYFFASDLSDLEVYCKTFYSFFFILFFCFYHYLFYDYSYFSSAIFYS